MNRLLPNTPVRIRVEGRQVRTIGDEQFPTARAWQRRDMPLAAMLPQRSRQGQDGSVLFVRNGEIWTVTPKAGQPPKPLELDARGTVGADPVARPPRHGLPGRQRRRAPVSGDRPRAAGRSPPRSCRAGSHPLLEPRLRADLRGRQDEAGARLLEVSRSTLSVRPLSLPRFPAACS